MSGKDRPRGGTNAPSDDLTICCVGSHCKNVALSWGEASYVKFAAEGWNLEQEEVG